MAERKWGAIASGATFEALATTLVRFEDPKASLFGRDGKDGGQDARSGDGTRVFQAKHHQSGSAAAAIRDAKNEAKKIEEYRQPGHTRYDQWKGVTHWRLVTNAAFNPTDQRTWETEVVPLFAKQGLVADYWEREDLNALLDKHPEVHRSFFENDTRVFLSIAEVKERLPGREPFLRRDELGPFCGRTQEKSTIREFLDSEKFFLVVHGAGGTGKTRLLVEAGDDIANGGEWQVLWANVESMAASSTWFDAVVPERATLLLVDEPSDETLLQQLAEQLGGRIGRTAKWKVAVAVRSPKDPVLRFLRSARMMQRVQDLAISALPSADAEKMSFDLLATGNLAGLPEDGRREAARQLSTRFARFPVWLTLAVQHLEDRGDLTQIPNDAAALADEYLREIEKSQSEAPPETVRDLLRWVALLGTVNREDETAIQVIGEGAHISSATEVRSRLETLVRRRALFERGAHNRLIELKPDVLRDHVLRRWLSTPVGGAQSIVASDDAKKLLDEVQRAILTGKLSGLGRAILVSLARTDLLLRIGDEGHDLQLVVGLFTTLEASVPSMTASQRLALVDVLQAVAFFHPSAATSLTMRLRTSAATDETITGIFGSRVLGQGDVVLALAWPLFHAAMGAQSAEDRAAVLRELCALVEIEADLEATRRLPNDGKRAAALVTRVIQGGPQFWTEYDDTAKQLAVELIDVLGQHAPTRGQIALLKSLVQPVLALERQQLWADDGRSMTWRTFNLAEGSAGWHAREATLSRLKEALDADATPVESRVQLWQVFAHTRGEPVAEKLAWTYRVLTRRTAMLQELAAARHIWEWHLRYEKDDGLKSTAEKLEGLYASDALAREFEPLLSRDLVDALKHTEERASAKAAELASLPRPEDISSFLDRAIAFLDNQEQQLYRLAATVGWALGEHAESRDVVRQFVTSSIEQPKITPRSEFGVATAVRWVAAVRTSTPKRAHVLVSDLLARCGSDEQRANLLIRLYGRIPKLSQVGEFTPEERALLRTNASLFTNPAFDVSFVGALALSVGHEWDDLRPLLEAALRGVSPDRLPLALYTLVDALYWATSDKNGPEPPHGLAEWLMTQLLELPDPDDLGGNGEWHLTELLKQIGPVGIQWLPGALKHRREQESRRAADYKSRALSYHARVSKHVRKLAASDATDRPSQDAIEKLLAFTSDDGTVGYYLPEVLHDVDPDGVLVPATVATRIRTAATAEDVRRLARIGGAYPMNGPPWRAIALAAIRASTPFGSDAVRSTYGALTERGFRSWSGPVGEVAATFKSAVDTARSSLDAEVEADLRPLWEFRLARAEAELREEEERAKEARDE